MQLKISNRIFAPLSCVVVLGVSLAMWADTPARKKARYYYSAGIQEQAKGNEASAYEYFKRAYNSDPNYAEAASAYGTRRLYISIDTLQSDVELHRSLGMMRQYVDAYPEDLYESLYYGYVASQLDNVDEAVRVLERAAIHHPASGNILLQLSEAYARGNNLPKAIDAITRYERVEGLSPQITTRKLSYLLAESDTVGAIREATRLVESSPKNPSFRILKGNVFDIIQMPDSALTYYTQAEMLDPESGVAKLALAEYYRQQGDSTAYDNKIYEVLLTDDLDVGQKTELLADYLETLLRDKGEKKRGDYLFSVLHNKYPHEPKLLDLGARYSAANSQFKDAEEQISYAIDLDPTNETFWGQLITYQAMGDMPERALETFDRATEHVTPQRALVLYTASVAQMIDNYKKAEELYRGIVSEIDPDLQIDSVLSLNDVRRDISIDDLDMLSRVLTSLGDVLNSTGRQSESYTLYDNAILFDPTNHMAKNNYAYFLSLNGGDLDKALQLSSQAIIGEDKDNPTYLDTYAWINFLKGDIVKAEEIQRKAVKEMEKVDNLSAEIYDHLGDILLKKGDVSDAIEAWKKAAKVLETSNEKEDNQYELILKKIQNEEKSLRQ